MCVCSTRRPQRNVERTSSSYNHILSNSPILAIAKYRTIQYVDGTDVHVCLTQALSAWTIGYFLMIIALFFVLPLVVLVVLYTIIARHLISSDGAMLMMRPSKPEQSQRARKQVVLMLGAVVLSFFVCLLPFRVFTLFVILVPEEHWRAFSFEYYYILLYFCRVMLYLNSAVNPILYNLMSSKFRQGFRRVYCCCARDGCLVGVWRWQGRQTDDGMADPTGRGSGGRLGQTAGGTQRNGVTVAGAATASSYLTHSSCSATTSTTTGRSIATTTTMTSGDLAEEERALKIDDSTTSTAHQRSVDDHTVPTTSITDDREIVQVAHGSATKHFQRTLSAESHCDPDELRRRALCNFGRNMRSLELAEAQRVRRQTIGSATTRGERTTLTERQRLLFQYSLDESKLVVRMTTPTAMPDKDDDP